MDLRPCLLDLLIRLLHVPVELNSGHVAQCRQIVLNRLPDQSFVYSLVLVPIDVAGGGDGRPVQLAMPVP